MIACRVRDDFGDEGMKAMKLKTRLKNTYL